MSSLGFTRMATVTASTKRPPAISSGIRGAATANLSSLACFPLDPLDPELRARLGIDTPHELLQTFVQGGLDIVEGDLLTVSSVDYPIRAVEEWYWPHDSANYLRLIVEELKR